MLPPTPQAARWGDEATCLRPVESNAGVGDRDRAAQKAPEGVSDRQTDTVRPLYDDTKCVCIDACK